METSWVSFPADSPLLVYKVALMVFSTTLSKGAGVSAHVVPCSTALLDLLSGRFDDLATISLGELPCSVVRRGVALVWRAISAPLVLALLVGVVVLLANYRVNLAHPQQGRVSVFEGDQALGLLLALLNGHGFCGRLASSSSTSLAKIQIPVHFNRYYFRFLNFILLGKGSIKISNKNYGISIQVGGSDIHFHTKFFEILILPETCKNATKKNFVGG